MHEPVTAYAPGAMMLAFPPLPVTPGVLAFLLLAALAAGLARGFSGFGAALILVPLASAAVGPRIAIPLLLVVDGAMTLGMIPDAWRRADRRDVMTMAVGALVGIPAGIYLLLSVDPITIRWMIVATVVALLTLLISGWRYHGRPTPQVTVSVGVVAGLFAGTAQVGGPAVVAYWLGRGLPAQVVRANIVLYFAISTVISGTGYVWSGLIDPKVLILSALVAPAYGLGVWLGSRMFGLASDVTFRRICFAMIAIAAVSGMPVLDGILH